jgi:Macrocin-O-methyltransferase (TylF)
MTKISVKAGLRSIFNSMGYEVYNTKNPGIWSEDGLSTYHNFSFAKDPEFQRAYARGIKANDGKDHHMRWRVHVALWVAQQVANLEGDFVECGVSTGFVTSAIIDRLNQKQISKRFFLFDTWQGLDPMLLSASERKTDRLGWYKDVKYDSVVANFAEFRNVQLVRGSVPETLSQVGIQKVCYLSLDMNCTLPEIAAAEHFWPKLVPGAMMLLDDYAYSGYEEQHEAFDAFAKKVGTQILSLPTGQGIIMKSFAG